MTSKSPVPDYDLDERMELTSADQVRAIGHPLRTTILGLLHERAATVTEMATAVGRPKSTVAHHVNVLQRAGLVQVVRRAECKPSTSATTGERRGCSTSASGSAPTAGHCRWTSTTSTSLRWNPRRPTIAPGVVVHPPCAHPARAVAEFWTRGVDLVQEFERLPRSGAVTYGFVAGVYPIPDYPALPDPEEVKES